MAKRKSSIFVVRQIKFRFCFCFVSWLETPIVVSFFFLCLTVSYRISPVVASLLLSLRNDITYDDELWKCLLMERKSRLILSLASVFPHHQVESFGIFYCSKQKKTFEYLTSEWKMKTVSSGDIDLILEQRRKFPLITWANILEIGSSILIDTTLKPILSSRGKKIYDEATGKNRL